MADLHQNQDIREEPEVGKHYAAQDDDPRGYQLEGQGSMPSPTIKEDPRVKRRRALVIAWMTAAGWGLFFFDMFYLILAPIQERETPIVIILVAAMLAVNVMTIYAFSRLIHPYDKSEKQLRRAYFCLTVATVIMIVSPIAFRDWMPRHATVYQFPARQITVQEDDKTAGGFQKTFDYLYSISDLTDYYFDDYYREGYVTDKQYDRTFYMTELTYGKESARVFPNTVKADGTTIIVGSTTLRELKESGWDIPDDRYASDGDQTTKSVDLRRDEAEFTVMAEDNGGDIDSAKITGVVFSANREADAFSYDGLTFDSDIRTTVSKLGPPAIYKVTSMGSDTKVKAGRLTYDPSKDTIELWYMNDSSDFLSIIYRYDPDTGKCYMESFRLS